MEPQQDLITGRPLPQGDDEPVRQGIEALLLRLGYERAQVTVDAQREIAAEGGRLRVLADLLVHSQGRPALVLRCARGSLVTREKEALALARLLHEPWVPLAVVTNGQEAELLEVASGRVLAQGLAAIPGPPELAARLAAAPPHHPTPKETQQAARVYAAFSGFHCEAYCR
ncbi:MAG: type I restriction enzyme HsdR N-terminal domain-containing protein [Thermodesulfobacteriota bacterium]